MADTWKAELSEGAQEQQGGRKDTAGARFHKVFPHNTKSKKEARVFSKVGELTFLPTYLKLTCHPHQYWRLLCYKVPRAAFFW